MGAPDDPGHLDFLAFSAHKMYAPFGAGVLIGARDTFAQGEPRLVGGGTVSIVDAERVAWAAPPDREEAGTPCITGAIALAAAIGEYRRIGWEAIVAHERGLAARRARWAVGDSRRPDLRRDRPAQDRLAVVAFNVEGLPHALVSAVLREWGIGTRSGCFCAHPYVKALLGVDADASLALEARIVAGDHRDVPGMVRASFGLTNTLDDAKRLVEAVGAIAAGHYRQCYALDPADGEYTHSEARSDFAEFFHP